VPELSQIQARHLQLAAQGLLVAPTKAATPLAVRRCIERMQLLQIDTIHVVARSPYLVLHSRLGHYAPQWLDQALARGHVAETWAHEACLAPTQDLALHRAYNAGARQHWGIARGQRMNAQAREHLDKLLAHVRETGPVKSSDFERKDDRTSAWWGWKDEKLWLEALFANGELMVARRDNFQRVYDLPEHVWPGLRNIELPPPNTVHAAFIEKSVAALGITQARWIHDYFRIKPRLKDSDLDTLVAQGVVSRVAVQGWAVPGYVHASNARLLRQALRGQLQATHTAILSPFDPLIWDRERVAAMFGFDYRIECYTPQEKRKYGYFVLPLLHRGNLIGRLDAKAHRVDGVFEVKALFLEHGVELDDPSLQELALAIARCAHWHETPKVVLQRSSPPGLRGRLQKTLKAMAPGDAMA
jgi:uncharacterized protein YcaQ